MKRVDDEFFDQQKLANLSDVSQSHLSTILTGDRNASQKVVRKLAEALGMSPGETERWVVLNSLPDDSPYSLNPEDIPQMLSDRFIGIGEAVCALNKLVDLGARQTELLEQFLRKIDAR